MLNATPASSQRHCACNMVRLDVRALLPHVMLLFGVGFLIANLRVGLDLLRFWRRRRQALLIWPGRRPPYYGLILFLGVTLGLLLIVKFTFLQRSASAAVRRGDDVPLLRVHGAALATDRSRVLRGRDLGRKRVHALSAHRRDCLA